MTSDGLSLYEPVAVSRPLVAISPHPIPRPLLAFDLAQLERKTRLVRRPTSFLSL